MYEPQDFAKTIFDQRYAISQTETYEEACDRVASHVAAAENGNRDKWKNRFTTAMKENRFIPGGRIWYGSGRMKGQLLNCFVLGITDSREGWGKAFHEMTVVSGTGGGVGMNFSPIRPRGTPIRGTGGTATGAVSVMEMIDAIGEGIKAGGGRRTALMQCLRYDHADIMEFLNKKFNKVKISEDTIRDVLADTYPNLPKDEVDAIVQSYGADNESIIKSLIKYQLDQRLKNANVSVLVDNHFFELIKKDEDVIFEWNNKEISRVSASEIWNIIVQNSWESGEPGILNIGLANEMNNIYYHAPLISTNPCGEIFLEENGCCDLGAINLVSHIDPKTNEIDWDMMFSM